MWTVPSKLEQEVSYGVDSKKLVLFEVHLKPSVQKQKLLSCSMERRLKPALQLEKMACNPSCRHELFARRVAMRALRGSCGPMHVPRGPCGASGSIPSGSDGPIVWRGSTRVLEEAEERVYIIESRGKVWTCVLLFTCVVRHSPLYGVGES